MSRAQDLVLKIDEASLPLKLSHKHTAKVKSKDKDLRHMSMKKKAPSRLFSAMPAGLGGESDKSDVSLGGDFEFVDLDGVVKGLIVDVGLFKTEMMKTIWVEKKDMKPIVILLLETVSNVITAALEKEKGEVMFLGVRFHSNMNEKKEMKLIQKIAKEFAKALGGRIQGKQINSGEQVFIIT